MCLLSGGGDSVRSQTPFSSRGPERYTTTVYWPRAPAPPPFTSRAPERHGRLPAAGPSPAAVYHERHRRLPAAGLSATAVYQPHP